MILEKKYKKVILPFLVIGGILMTIWILLLMGKIIPIDKLFIAKRNLILPTVLFGGATVVVLASLKVKKFLLFAFCYLLFATSFDSFRFVQKWMPFDSKDLVFADIPIIETMKKNIGNGRYFGNLGDQVDSYYSFSSIEGYDPLYIDRYGEFIQSALSGEYVSAQRSVVKLDRRGKYTDRVLDFLGVSLIFHPRADTNQGWAYPVWKDEKRFTLVYKDDRFELYKNNFALPRASLFYDYEVISEKEDIIKRFYSSEFDFRKKIILEEKINLNKGLGTGSVKIVDYSPNKIKIDIETNKKAILLLSDNYYPGWKVKINGKETRILRTNYTFRGVIVPKGKSKVEFYYGLFF